MSLHPTKALLVLVAALVAPWAGPARAQVSNAITREVFLNIPGGAISDLTNNPAFPNSPSIEDVLTNYMEIPVNAFENYGTRLRALITPPASGEYTFWIASDDPGNLFLSTDASPANKVLIARVNTWTSSREWTKETNQRSAPITLAAGQQYYIEALQKEGGGGDNLAVRWQLPGGLWENPGDTNLPIPALRCVSVGVTAPLFTQQPTNVTVVEGQQTTFSVRFTRSFGATVQWQCNGTNVPGQTGTNYLFGPATLADHNSIFRCVVSNGYGVSITTNALLQVTPDATPPTVSSVGNLGDSDVITVVFSEAVEAASATNTAHYAINNGIAILGAGFGVDARTIVLITTPLAANVTYTLTVNNVRDRAQTPNTIATNTQRTFNINTRPVDAAFLRPGPEVPGPSTRRGPIVISEVMYHPTNRTDLRNIEFIEIFNSNPWFEELGGWRLSGAIDYTFPSNFVLQARSYAVVAANPADISAVYGLAGALGPWTGNLQNSEGTLRLRNPAGAVLFEMEYSGETPFPAAADGTGHSLVLARPSYGEGDPRAWSASDLIGGTPGTNEVLGANSHRSLVINEFLAHTDLPDLDYIELYNYSTAPFSIAGCILTDDPLTNKYVFPAGSIIPANGFVSLTETALGFALSAAGETVYLKSPGGTRVLDAVRFDGQENGVATGRVPDGAPAFHRLQTRSPGTANGRQRPPVVVINELMYDPLNADDRDEYIELHNPGASPVNVGKWRLRGGVKFTLPTGSIIPAGGYLVIAADAPRLRSAHAHLNFVNCLGNWEGSLRNRGERVELTMPDTIVSTNGLGQPVTNTIHIVMDEVSYRDGGRWGRYSAAGGSSMELRDARADRRLAPNWGDSDESAKQGWVNVEATGTLDHGWENATQLHVTLLGEGEVLLDNIELTAPVWLTNLIGNGTFETGTEGWVFQGNHNATSWETNEGYASARSLHLRTTGRGDSGANRLRTQFPFTLPPGTTNVTLRAKVRWLKGNPNVLLRVRGNYHEAPGYTVTVKNFGTPALPNSLRVTNAPPAITEVAHWPPLPAANQPVLVTARAHDPDGLASFLLSYRLDPATNFTTVSLTNNGAGLFSAVIPGQPAGVQAAFYLEAADKLAPARGAKFPDDAPVRECVVRWGDTTVPGTGGLGTYRFWITQKVIDQWVAEERMSNKPKDVTYIYGTNRVVYNAGAWFHGSPYHSPAYNSPVGTLCDYDMGFPEDDRLFGETDINLFRPGNGGGDGTAQAEIHAQWFGGQLGNPHLYHRPVFLYVNGALRNSVVHDAQQPNGDFVEQWYPDDAGGELHKIQLGFEFGDTAYGNGEAGYAAVGANFARYLTAGGQYKRARYRATLPWRSASPDEQNDYTNTYALVEASMTTAALNTDAYTVTLTNMFDVRQWYRTHVVQHLIGNGDSFSYGGGQNAFMYKPTLDKWKLFLWDVDFAFGGNASDPNLFGIGGADHGPRNTHAPFERIYWQTLIEAANGMLLSSRSDPILDARYAGMAANGAAIGSPSGIKTFIQTRRNVVLGYLSTNNTSPFEITSNGGVDFSSGNNLVTLAGRAPFEIARIEVNGTAYHLTWTTRTNWTLRLALPYGTNVLSVVGYDQFGRSVAGATDTINVNITAPGAPPRGNVVFNEIMFHPRVPDAEYLEVFNVHASVTFDLSGWRVEGADYTFPEGYLLPPRNIALLVKDTNVFAQTYGSNLVSTAVFNGNLQANGETLTLIKPGLTPETDEVIDKVRYEPYAPWSTNASGTGSSFQLIDAAQDNSRPGNWWALHRTPVWAPEVIDPGGPRDGWRFFAATGLINATNLAQRLVLYLGEPSTNHSSASALIDDLALVTGTNPAVGFNYIRNGDFESPLDAVPLTNSWIFGTNYTNSHLVSDLVHSGSGALKIVGTSAGTIGFGNNVSKAISQAIDPVPWTRTNTLSFWYWATNSATNLYVRLLNSTGLTTATNPANGPTNITIFIAPSNYIPPTLVDPGTNTLSPGLANTGTATTSPIPPLWLNEVQATNVSGRLDNNGQRDPWVELYNAGTNTVTLTNLFLSDNYTNLTRWSFPPGLTLGPGQFLVIVCDGETNQSTGLEPHASFRLLPGSGHLALSRLWNGTTQALDYLNYLAGPDRSYGSFPDGQPFTRREFFHVTPGATNNGTLPPVPVLINEWMADNVAAFPDPVDGNYEDWFELYNNSDAPVSLAGYFLTDDPLDKFKFEIPAGTVLPARGYLLVWADNEPAQNAIPTGDLHVNFSLSRSGDFVGLFTPDGLQLDAFTFYGQITDVTTGRFPDGQSQLYFLTNVTPRAANYLPLPNVPPVIDPVPDRTVFEGDAVNFTITATDSNLPAQILTWTFGGGAPAGATLNVTNGTFGWTPSETQGGNTFHLTVLVYDNGSPFLYHTQQFSITVLKTNSAPGLALGGASFVNEGDTISFTALGTDTDLPAQALTYSLDPAALALGATIHPTTGLFTWTPGEPYGPGAYTLAVLVRDNGSPALSNAALVTITVNESNLPPALNPIPDRTAALGELVSLTAVATDPDLPAQTITYDFAAPPPAGAAIHPATGLLTWTANTVGTNTFHVRATDHGPGLLADTRAFTVLVAPQDITTSITLSNQTVHLRWNALSNRAYAVDYKPDLTVTNWTPLQSNILATGPAATATDPVGTNVQRLYRIRLQPAP